MKPFSARDGRTLTKKRDVYADANAALREMADDFRGTGLMSEDTYQEIAMFHLDEGKAVIAAPPHPNRHSDKATGYAKPVTTTK